MFVDRKFSVLAYYDSTKPWTGDRLVGFLRLWCGEVVSERKCERAAQWCMTAYSVVDK